jgi:hypothetical protein
VSKFSTFIAGGLVQPTDDLVVEAVYSDALHRGVEAGTIRFGPIVPTTGGWMVAWTGRRATDEPASHDRPAHPSYVLWFGTFAAWWIGSEIFRGFIPAEWWWWWPAGFIAFLVVELAGATREAIEADTWSEFHWKFGRGLPARDDLLRASGWAFAYRAATLPFLAHTALGGTVPDWFLSGPWWVLMFGVGRWLHRHFPEGGETG